MNMMSLKRVRGGPEVQKSHYSKRTALEQSRNFSMPEWKINTSALGIRYQDFVVQIKHCLETSTVTETFIEFKKK